MEITVSKLNEIVANAVTKKNESDKAAVATPAPVATAPVATAPVATVATPVATDPALPNPTFQGQLDKIVADAEALKSLQTLVDSGKLVLPGVEKQADDEKKPDESKAELEQNPVASAVRSLDGIAGQGMPWGSALVGGATGLILSELIDGFRPPTGIGVDFVNVAFKLGGAWASVQFLPMVAGRTAGLIAAGVLLFSVAREIAPIEDGIQWVIKTLKGGFGGSNRFAQSMGVTIAPVSGGGHVGMAQVLPGFGGPGVDAHAGIFR